MFARGITGAGRHTDQASETGDADDATLRCQQMRQRVVSAIDRTHVIDLHDAFENSDVLEIGEFRPHRHAGVADQGIDAAKPGHRCVDNGFAFVGLGDIG